MKSKTSIKFTQHEQELSDRNFLIGADKVEALVRNKFSDSKIRLEDLLRIGCSQLSDDLSGLFSDAMHKSIETVGMIGATPPDTDQIKYYVPIRGGVPYPISSTLPRNGQVPQTHIDPNVVAKHPCRFEIACNPTIHFRHLDTSVKESLFHMFIGGYKSMFREFLRNVYNICEHVYKQEGATSSYKPNENSVIIAPKDGYFGRYGEIKNDIKGLRHAVYPHGGMYVGFYGARTLFTDELKKLRAGMVIYIDVSIDWSSNDVPLIV